MRDPHHPKVSRRNDGCWVLNCPECMAAASVSEIPIGIGLPVDSEETARRLFENHVGPAPRSRRPIDA